MKLMTVHGYGGNLFGFYGEQRKEIYMTINELAIGFGYKSKKGIEEMIRRRPYLKKRKYSFMVNLPVRNYGTDAMGSTTNKNGTPQSVGTTKSKIQFQEVRVFTERGILEIGCISQTNEAEKFRDWVFKQLQQIKKAFTVDMLAHTQSKDLQKMLHDAVYNSPAYAHKENKSKEKTLINFNKLLIKTASRGRATDKASMTAEDIQTLEHLQHKTIALLNEGKDYQYIKSVL